MDAANMKTDHENILMIVVDQWRGDALRAAGNTIVKTPNVDRLSARGVTFLNHYTQAAPCAPGRTSMLTGMYQANHRVVRNGTPLDARHTNIALEMRRLGYDPVLTAYTTGTPDPRKVHPSDPRFQVHGTMIEGFTAIAPMFPLKQPYFAFLRANGFDVPDDPTEVWLPAENGSNRARHGFSAAPSRYPAALSDTAYCTDKALEYLNNQRGKRWFLHLGYWRPHPPFIAPAPFHEMFEPSDMPAPARADSPDNEAAQHPLLKHFMRSLTRDKFFRHGSKKDRVCEMDDDDFRQAKATYYGMMAEVDAQVGRVLDWLEASGEIANTLIVFTSDHGEQMGDHHMFGKQGYFSESFHIPMIVVDPRPEADATRGTTVSRFTETVDLMPTVMDWKGTEIPRQCDGRSLLPFCHGEEPDDWRTEAHFEFDFRDVRNAKVEQSLGLPMDHCNLAVIQDESYKYVHFTGLPPLFFDLSGDAGQTRNLADDAGYRDKVLDYAQRLLSWRMANHERTLTGMNADVGGLVVRQ